MIDVILLGASGNIGKQTLEVLKKEDDKYNLIAISVGKNFDECINILKSFKSIKFCYIINEFDAIKIKQSFPNLSIYFGDDGLKKMMLDVDASLCINALVGFVGLEPTLIALNKNMDVALANKEALVVGGQLVNDLLKQGKGHIYPIDSEHAAIHKCLAVDDKNVKRLILTASGGAFRKYTRLQTKDFKKEDALKHPTWNMGAKITIDCATMMNKCFEIIEAHFLFNYPYDRISILLHDESMIHSMVEYNGGSFRAEISYPDMKNPIYYAIHKGHCEFDTYISDDYHKFGDYHFHEFDIKRYPLVKFAEIVIKNKGTYGTVLNASNEVAVNAFLNDEIGFLDIEDIVFKMMEQHQNILNPTYEMIYQLDQNIRLKTHQLIKELKEKK